VDEAEKKLLLLRWPALKRELSARTKKPFFYPGFVIFFVVAILGLAPAGFWIEVYLYLMSCSTDPTAIRNSFVSFVPAFVAATCMQLIWAEEKKSIRAFAVLLLAICVLGLVLCRSSHLGDSAAIAWGTVSTLTAWWMWWIANANQKEFQEEEPDSSSNPIGGTIAERPLIGDLTGFKV
jgi:undecaprenyl pyrophosphate phosphatase UppP